MAMTRKQIREFHEKKQEIEENTLKSTTESIRLLRETQQCGIATAEELNRQGEQLKTIDKELDSINAKLSVSQKHINGMKSMFGGFKNFFGIQEDNEPDQNNQNENGNKELQTKSTLKDKTHTSATSEAPQPRQQLTSEHDFKTRFEDNMNEMSKSISMLKGLATDMGQEIGCQNMLIGEISRKTEQADITTREQNKQMTKILR